MAKSATQTALSTIRPDRCVVVERAYPNEALGSASSQPSGHLALGDGTAPAGVGARRREPPQTEAGSDDAALGKVLPASPTAQIRARRRREYAFMRLSGYSRADSAICTGISYSTARRWEPRDLELPEGAL